MQPDNILLDLVQRDGLEQGSRDWHARLADFGLVQMLPDLARLAATGCVELPFASLLSSFMERVK